MDDNSNEIKEYFAQQVNILVEQLQLIDSNIEQLHNTFDSLKAIKESKDSELLLPISNGIFLKSNAKDIKNLLVNVGTNIVVEKSIEDVEELINNKISELEDNHKQLLEQYTATVNMLNQL